jgi:hypothetical protein
MVLKFLTRVTFNGTFVIRITKCYKVASVWLALQAQHDMFGETYQRAERLLALGLFRF